MTDVQATLDERGGRYGSFSTHAAITQSLKGIIKASPQWDNMTDAQQEALEMIAHKIGRICNGDPNYDDSWVDIAGYAQLVVNILQSNPK